MPAFTPQAARIPPRPSEPFVDKGFSPLSALFPSAILDFVEFRLHRILHHAFRCWTNLIDLFPQYGQAVFFARL